MLDEPANGLDPTVVADLRELLASLAQQDTTTIVIASRIVADYIGSRRIAHCRYPGGRDPLFQANNIACALVIGTASRIGCGAAVSVFLLTESFTAIAGAIGIWRRSTIATLVAAIILIALLGNVVVSLNGTPGSPGSSPAQASRSLSSY